MYLGLSSYMQILHSIMEFLQKIKTYILKFEKNAYFVSKSRL